MEKQRENRHARAAHQVEEMRRLYSRIGEPLPMDVIIDLHRHLDKALALGRQSAVQPPAKKRRSHA